MLVAYDFQNEQHYQVASGLVGEIRKRILRWLMVRAFESFDHYQPEQES